MERKARRRGDPHPANGNLGKALRQYEALEELVGRLVSYAGLVYAGNTSDPQRAKLYGDIQEKYATPVRTSFSSRSNSILWMTRLILTALDADAGFGHYRPWVLDLRKDKPYQLEPESSSCSTKSRS